MKEIVVNTNLIAACGLYCGACKAYLRERCPGCKDNVKASWCKVRTCCFEHNWLSCAECTDFEQVNACAKYNNIIARIFGFIFRSDRTACIDYIKKEGREDFARYMTEKKRHTFPRT
ncbi:DUF3795 domain-containing protein [bacterium]|nr:DUF3795 domain-containing protein [bacterium]